MWAAQPHNWFLTYKLDIITTTCRQTLKNQTPLTGNTNIPTRFIHRILCWFWCLEIGTSSIHWTQLRGFHLRMETEFSLQKYVSIKNIMIDNVQKQNNCIFRNAHQPDDCAKTMKCKEQYIYTKHYISAI
jgi:hypothetical protein